MDNVSECALNGGEVGLNLPTVVGGPVVGEDEFPVRHGADWHGNTELPVVSLPVGLLVAKAR